MIDFEEVNLLLGIVHGCASAGPAYAGIAMAADRRLKEINAEAVEDSQPRTVVAPKPTATTTVKPTDTRRA